MKNPKFRNMTLAELRVHLDETSTIVGTLARKKHDIAEQYSKMCREEARIKQVYHKRCVALKMTAEERLVMLVDELSDAGDKRIANHVAQNWREEDGVVLVDLAKLSETQIRRMMTAADHCGFMWSGW